MMDNKRSGLNPISHHEERQHVACDPHDNLFESLTGIALQMETVRRLLTGQENAAALDLTARLEEEIYLLVCEDLTNTGAIIF